MGEKQPVIGAAWNLEANRFLTALGWHQLGTSQVDVECDLCGGTHGVDSVFYYQDPLSRVNQGVVVDAKTYAWKNCPTSVIQGWVDDLIESVEHLPQAVDFQEKFSPPQSTRFVSGLVVLWVNDTENYNVDKLALRLRGISLPRKRSPIHVFFISNRDILRLCAIVDEMQKLRDQQQNRDVTFFYPHRTDNDIIHCDVLPIEYIFSKYIFATLKTTREAEGGVNIPVEENRVFYIGDLDRESLEFMKGTLLDLQFLKEPVYIHCSSQLRDARNSIDEFQRENPRVEFEQLVSHQNLPGWML